MAMIRSCPIIVVEETTTATKSLADIVVEVVVCQVARTPGIGAVPETLRLVELPLAVLQEFHPQIDNDVYAVLSLRGSLEARSTLGGTAPAQVRQQIARHRARLA